MWNDEDRKWLYDQMKNNGVNAGSYDDFAKSLENKEDRDWYYQKSRSLGFNVGSADDFASMMVQPWQQQMSMNVGNSVRQTIQTLNQRQKNVGEYSRQRMQRPLKQQRVVLGSKNKGVLTTPSDSKNLEQGRNEYNPETGKFESTYITSVGNKYNDSGVANMEQRQIDDALEHELRPVETELRDAYAERDRLSRQMNSRYETLDDAKPTVSFGAGQAFTGSAMKTLSDDEFNQLSAAYDENHKRIKLLEAKRRDAGFFGGLTDVIFDPRTWTNGLNDLKNTLTMLSYAKGGKKTDSGEQMLESRNKREIAEATHGDDLSWWYGVGKMAGEMLPFAIQIGATGGFSGIANKGIGATTSLASKVANPILSKSLKYTGVVASEMAAGLAVANTAGVGNTLSAVGERYLGHVDSDEQGNYSFAGGENGMTAFVKGELGQMLEYGTEGLGKHLHLGSRVLKGLDKIGASKITNFFNKIGGSRYGKEVGEFLGSVGIQGYPEEVMEEEINILMNSILVGDNKLSDLWDSKTQKDIWGGMLLSLGFMGALPTSLYGGKRGYDAYKYQKLNNKVKDADRVAASRLTDNVWTPLRERIDNTPNNTMQDVIEEICNSESLAQEEKEAALNYIRHSMVFRGYNMGTVANMKDVAASGEITDEQADAYSADKSYTLGYNTTEPKDMQDLIHNMDYQRERISNFANSDDMAILDGNPTEAFDAIRSNNQWSEEQKEIATEYVNARNSHVAMLQRINDDADALANEGIERMRQMQHADGSLHSATLKETDENGQDKQVYVVEGNVQMMADGSMVDPATSDKSVVIYDPATGEKKMIDPTADTGIHSLDDVVTAADFEAGIERSREEYVQSRIDEAKGTVRLVPGQQLVLPTGEEAVVVATDGDNATVTLGDGSQTNVSLAELQRIKDEEAMADYRQRHGINEEQTEQPYGADLQERSQGSDMDGASVDFTPDMELVVRDEDDNEKPAMVMGRVRYENGKLVPDDNGNIIEYYMDGEVMHEHESVLADKVVSRVLSTDVGNGVTAEDINEREGDEWDESDESDQSVQSEESEESEESNEEISAIERIPFVTDEKTGEAVLNKKGKRQYLWHEASVDDTAAAIAEINDGSLVDARDTAQAMIEKAQKGLENAQKVKVTGDDPIEIAENRAAVKRGIEVARNIVEHWKNVRQRLNSKISEESARIAAEAEAQKSAEEKAEEERERERQRQIVEERERNRIAEEIERDKKKRSKEYAPLVNARKEFADDDTAMSILEDTEPRDLDEWVSSFITPHSMMWNDESMDGRVVRGLKSELGLSAKDMQSYMNLLAPSNSGGKPFDTVVHDIWENLPSAIKQAYTDHDVRNSLIGLFGEGSSTRMRNLIAERRIAEARDMHDAMLRAEEEALEEWAEAFHLTANERETFYEYMQSSVEIDDETASVLADIFGEAYGLSENDNNNNNTEIYGKQDKGGDFLDREPFEGGAPKESIGGKKEVSGQSSGETTGDAGINGSESEGTFVEDATPVVTDNVAGRAEIENAVQSALAVAEQETNTEPTEAQKEAGNYKKGHFKIDGFDVTVENPKGSVRRGTDTYGKQWEQEMQNTYGYIRGTEGVDGDHIDVFFSEDPSQGDVFVVDQVNEDGSFDEHKVMYGFSDIESARKAYLSNYEDGWQGLGAITPVSKEVFKKWIDSSHRKTKPFAEYSSVKPLGDTQLGEHPKATVRESEDYVDAAARIARENEVKQTAAHFPMETQEEAATFDKRVPEMDHAELLTYMREDGKGDMNKAHHPSVYDEYDYRHSDEQLQSYDATLVRLSESGTTLEQAEEMLANLQKDTTKFATEERAELLGKEEALQEYIEEQEKIVKSSSDAKIDDVGERLEGARKDMHHKIAEGLANVTEAELIAKPFGKVYKKPDLKKAVESGALREKDAVFYEALFSMVNQQKPKVTQSELRRKRYIADYKTKAERWAASTFKQMEVLRQFIEADERERDAMMEQMLADRYPTHEHELAEVEKRKELNPDYEGHKYEWGDKTTPNPLWITYDVMNKLGYDVGDKLNIPYSVVKANTSGTGYGIENLKGEQAIIFGSNMTLDEAINTIVYMSHLKHGDRNISHPTHLFAFPATKSESGESGRYRVMWGRDYKTREFDTKEKADAFAQTKKHAFVSPIMEIKRRFGYKVRFHHPLTGEKMFVDDTEFDTKDECKAYFDSNFEKINDATNAKLQEEREKKGEKKTLTADDVVQVTILHSAKGGLTHAVVIDKKYANNDGQVRVIKEGFANRHEAETFAGSIKDEVLKTIQKHKEDAKKIVYFDTGENSRIGEDYRDGKDVEAEDFMNTFGFRGVQFGNWTNQADRQMAINQAYDAFMDMAKLIGISPRAMSLNGELGIAFGARGVGGFAAHYEGGESVVINLTKTKGAGSLAHEWWHALDNYFARREGRPLDMATDNRQIAMRDELRKAFDDMLDLVKGSNYAQRSTAKGEYWGRTHEVTARLLAEWIDVELKKRGELNTFLSRGAVVERGQEANYLAYETLELLAGREPISFDDYKELPESLNGIPYPSIKEVEQFGSSLRHIFGTLEERMDEETGNVLVYEPSSIYQDKHGTSIKYRSLFDEMSLRDEHEASSISKHSEQAQTTDDATTPSDIRMRKLKKGETCHVERVYEETKQFDFTGKDKVESAEDVAYIFRQLESAAAENSFLVLVKDGKPTVIHLGVGTYTATVAPYEQAFVAYKSLNPEQVYFVHNHPSGALKASNEDRTILGRIKRAFGEDVVQQGIIINTTSGNYGEYDTINTEGEFPEAKVKMSANNGNEVPIKVYKFSKQVFASDWNPETAFKIISSNSVAEFVSSHRLGAHKKMSFLVVSNNSDVVANVFLPWTKLSDIQHNKDAGDLLAGYVHQCGGARGILYGNYDYTRDDDKILWALQKRMREFNAPLMDALHVEHSAFEQGIIGEPDNTIYNGFDTLKEITGARGYRNNSAYLEGVTENGEKWVIRVSDHPIRESNLDEYNQEDADYVLSLVVDDDFDPHRQRQDAFHDERRGHYQYVLTSDDVFSHADHFRRIVERFKKLGGEEFFSDVVYREGWGSAAEAKPVMHEDANLVRTHAEQLGEKLNTPINIIEDMESITHSNAAVQERRRKSKGWYNAATGEVVVVLPNNRNIEDVTATIMHETVAHKGLRELVGEDNYGEFLDETYKHLRDDLKKDVDAAAGRAFVDDTVKNGEHAKSYEQHRRIATDELFGRLAEKPFEEFSEGERTLWQKIKATVRRLLDKFLGSLKLPKWFELGDNELRYMLWRSKERLERGKEHPIDLARDIVKREELGLTDEARYNMGDKSPDFHSVIDEIFSNAGFDKTAHQREHYDLGETPTWMKRIGIAGERFTLSFKNIKTHLGKDEDHNLTAREWHELPSALQKPFLVTTYGNEAGKFRLYTSIKVGNKFAVVGVDVVSVNKGKYVPMLELNRIKTVFGRDRYVVENGERILAWDKEITPEQESLLRGHNFREYPTIQELSAAKIVNNSETTSVEGQKVDESTDLYRDTDETEDIWKDQSMGLQERTTAAATRLANKHQDNKTLRNEAMRAIGGNLADLRKAMSLQRQFDMSTVKRVYDLARVLMNNGYLNGLNQQEVKRLFAAVKNSVGHNDIEGDVQKIMDIMVDNQLKHAEDTLHKLETIKGSKVDARGVEVQGQLDPTGAHIMKAFKDVRGWDMADIENAIADIVQRMDSSDNAVADEAAIEYTGAQLALEYARNIRDSKVEEKELRDQIKQAHDESSERDRKTDAYRQHVASLHEAIRQNKIERAQAYYDLVGKITGSLRESIANAQEFKEAEKQRIREIHHNANSDMEGRPSNEHYKPKFMDKFVNNTFVSFVFAPLSTFDQMLRLIGNKSTNGEGYLYNRFMRGWVDARQKEIKGVREKYGILDAKAAELFGGKVKTWGDLIRRVGKLPKGTVSFWNGGEMQEHELTQGNLMYIYMVNKMLDGRMKLRKMGITEENVADIEAVLDPRLMELADWLQNEFLVDTRNEYNETHKRMFGASMAAIENYFPLKILSNARADKAEDLDNPDRGDGISTATGSIIKRRRNSLALDITNADALHVILDHVAQMEHWNAYAEFNRDLNTLRTYKRFRNQVENMTTIYGSGKKLWKKFNDVCQMASGTYRPPRAMLDEAAVNFAKGVTAAKVSFRLFTALKQFLSAPAYLPEARADYLLADIVNPVGAWKWSMEHLPIFSERWHSRMSGDPRLLKSDMDWKMWRTRIMQLASRAGMSPNAFVDALTVSIGAHAMYKTRLGQYLRDGYEQSEAERRAIQDAEVLYNETQQSSEGAFTSTIQVDRSWLSVVFTVFRNSSMAYQRQLHDALRNMKRNLTPGQRAKSVEFMKKQLMRDGIDEAKAEASAKRKFRSQLLKDTIRIATFGYIMQLAWNLGAYLPYLLFGDDDDEKQKTWNNVFTHTMFGSLEGLTGGDALSQAGNILLSGEGNPAYISKDMPLTSDITSILKKLGGNQRMEAFTDIANLLVQAGLGVNPQSITDVALSIMDACGDDPALAHEATICIFRILQVPQSQIDKIYFDEVGLSGSEISQYTPTQLAERYACFKIKRGYLVTPWLWDDEGLVEKKKESAMKKIKERVEHLGSDEVNEAYLQHEGVYKGIDMQVKAIKKDMKDGKIDYVKAAQMMSAVQSDREAFATYQAFGQMDGMLNKIAKMYLASKSQEEAALCQKTMLDYKSAMVKVLDASDAESRTKAMQNLSGVMQDFSNKYVPMQQPNR